MQPSDFKRFDAVMNGMAEMHQRELSQFLLDAYWLAMRDWSLQDFESAAAHLMQELKWLPKPADFTALRKAGEPIAAEAWAQALAACVHWRTPDRLPQGRIARAAATVGGFREIAMADDERYLPHIQRRFMDAYDNLARVEPVRESLPQIAAAGARIALRGPTSIANFLPNLQPPEDSRASLAPEEFRS